MPSAALESRIQSGAASSSDTVKKTDTRLDNAVRCLVQAFLVVAAALAIVYLQTWREAPMWARLEEMEGLLSKVKDSKDVRVNAINDVGAQQKTVPQVWKTLQSQSDLVTRMEQEMARLRSRNDGFRENLGAVLQDLTKGISDLQLKLLPGQDTDEQTFEKSRFPVVWESLRKLEDYLERAPAVADPSITTHLKEELGTLQSELSATNFRVADMNLKYQHHATAIAAMRGQDTIRGPM